MPKFEDLTGRRFAKLVVLSRATNRGKQTRWLCKCDCGNETIVEAKNLKAGTTKSCGCISHDDLTGKRFGRLVVIERAGNSKNGRNSTWRCKCDCGRETTVIGTLLRNGHTQSCGCYGKSRLGENNYKHGKKNKRLYGVWCNMRQRCNDENFVGYKYYGGRGITVCEEWQEYLPFHDWAMGNGYREGLSIDRIDVDGNYCPENCRWATTKEQNNNTRANHRLSYNGETHTMSEWAEITGINMQTLWQRIKRGWTTEKALTTPVITKKAGESYE